jgi:hypothetical protein
MQMIVSNAIAKRIDDNSSTAARTTWGPRRTRRPWVETDMRSEPWEAKKAGHPYWIGPPCLGFVIGG